MMTNNPKDIRLNAEDRQRLARVADKKGASWRTVFREAIANYEQTFVPAEEMHRAVAALEEDTACLAQCAQELRDIEAELGPEALTLDNARRILAKDPRPLSHDIIADRGDR